jgi:uncharacterized membrane protein
MYSIEELSTVTDPAIIDADGMHPARLYSFEATPLSINSENVVVGSIARVPENLLNPGYSFAAVWQYGGLALLPTLASGDSASAYCINDSNTIVGCSGSIACRWDDQNVSALDLPDGYIASCAYGVNAAAEIVGVVGDGPGNPGVPCVWHADGHPEVLKAGFPFTEALAINDLGEVLLSDGLRLWTTWFEGAQELEGWNGQASAINNNGVVVGSNFWCDVLHSIQDVPFGLSSVNDNGLAVGCRLDAYWTAIMLQLPGATLTRLNDLLPWNDTWRLYCATAVNNSGAIVGSGMKASKPAAFLLNPIRFSQSTRPVLINRFGKFSKPTGGPERVLPSLGVRLRKEQALRALAFAARRMSGGAWNEVQVIVDRLSRKK